MINFLKNLKKPEETTLTKYMKIAAVILAVLVVVLEFRSCNKKEKEEKDAAVQQEQVKTISPQEALEMEKAYYASKKFVKEALTKVDSIYFPNYHDQVKISPSSNKVYIVETWADEISNSGIKIRHNYSAEMERKNGIEWQCRSLILNENKID